MIDRAAPHAVDMPWNGRARDEHAVARWARSVDPNILVIAGATGMGKTTTVLRALRSAHQEVAAVRVGSTTRVLPFAHGIGNTDNLDLTHDGVVRRSAGSGESALLPGIDVDAFVHRLTERTAQLMAPDVFRILFVDDIDVLTDGVLAELFELRDAVHPRNWRVVAGARVGPATTPDGIALRRLEPLSLDETAAVLHGAVPVAVATDVVERIHWWSAGNPGIAVELAESLSEEELTGATPWFGPAQPGAVARRVYGPAVARLSEPAVVALAGALRDRPEPAALTLRVPAGSPALPALADAELVIPDREAWVVPHPMAALLAIAAAGLDDVPGTNGTAPARSELPHSVVELGAGLAEPVVLAPGADARLRAAAFTVSLMSGQTAGLDLHGVQPPATDPGDPRPGHDEAWWDHVWWTEPETADLTLRMAGRRVATGLLLAERGHAVEHRSALAADLAAIETGPDPAPRSAFLLVRGFLVVGDPAGARSVLTRFPAVGGPWRDPGAGAERPLTVTDRIGLKLAAAMVAAVDGHYRLVREQVDRIERLRQVCAGWPGPRGLRALADAALTGASPPATLADEPSGVSPRALGEHAIDLGLGYFLLGRLDTAASLFAVGLDHCPWPYQGGLEVCAAAFEALLGHASPKRRHERLHRHVRAVLAEAVRHPDPSDDLAATTARARALLAGSGDAGADPVAAYEGALATATAHRSMKQRIQALLSYGRFLSRRGDDAGADSLLDQAATLARFAGLDGWARGIAPDHDGAGSGVPEPAWDEFDEMSRTLVQLAIRGTTNAEMAKAVFVSERTVVNRLREIYARLGVDGRRGLITVVAESPPPWIPTREHRLSVVPSADR